MNTRSTIVRCTTLALALAAGAPARAAEVQLFDNGPFVTDVGAGFEGAGVSRAQGTTITFSISNTVGTGLPTRVMDDFSVPAGQQWRITRLRFFATQSQSSASFSTQYAFAGAFARFFSIDPRTDDTAVIGGDLTTNRALPSSAFANAYRISRTSTNLQDRARPIFAVDVDASFMPALSEGTYFVEFAAIGDPLRAGLASTFPVTPLPESPNGSQFFNGAYVVGEGLQPETPFVLFGVRRCGTADLAGPGQSPDFDGDLTADDIIAYINRFFASDPRADLAGPGQTTGADGQFSADDIIVYIARFFEGCS